MKEGEIILLPVHFSYTTNDNGKLNNNPIENGKSKTENENSIPSDYGVYCYNFLLFASKMTLSIFFL